VRLQPDDDVYRINAVWLGPRGLTLPWVARYTAYAIWLTAFVAILLFEIVTPLPVGVPPVWEFAISVLATYAVMGLVDHERPLRSVLEVARAEVTGPRRDVRSRHLHVRPDTVRVRTRSAAPQQAGTPTGDTP
jgi:hypothetical protein